ncbi:hypothetical protein N7530_011617 [Penicillium desertorum]|uniref:Nephrocystin 3-like N-terminal domain-containing protein n=1 Tax=Penicillium desertorum TaxID=1303715 RepID=A0A9X0BFZ1_9EURO|nr:hypothetical protein N7530_011617 [Penicillium desertorum]
MFCPGIPGAGKTILSSVVIDELEARYCGDPQIGVAQLLCGLSPLPILYDKHEAKGTRPTIAELLLALSCITSSLRRWFLVLDALDECGLTDTLRLLDILSSFRTSDSNMSLFATSRFIPEIMTKLHTDAVVKEIRGLKSDITKYLEANMDELPLFVTRKPDLLFLLARLSLSSLKGRSIARDIRS